MSPLPPFFDSSSFNNKYEGDVYNNPGLPGYSEAGAAGFDAGPSTDGNILSYTSDGDLDLAFFESTNWPTDVTDANGWTLEVRVRILSETDSFGTFGINVADQTGGSSSTFFAIGEDHFAAINGTVTAIEETLDTNDNTDAFHTFRLAQEPNLDTFIIHRDGVSLGTFDANKTAAGSFFAFGDVSTTIGGQVEIDYVRFDSRGAFGIPEPSSLTLLAAVATLVLGWRRVLALR